MAASGVSLSSWIRNPIAWLVGLVLGTGFMRLRGSIALCRGVLILTLVGLVSTFLAPAQDGVHRWIDAGPLHVNMAALLLPSAVVALAFYGILSRFGLALAAAIAGLLALQPDASQVTSFVVAVIILLVPFSSARRALRLAALVAAVVLAAIAWSRPDPLKPVAEVEGIFALAVATSPVLAVAAAVA